MGKIFREGMEVPQDIDGGSAKPKKPKKKATKVKLPPLRKGEIDMPSDPDDGSVGMKKGGMTIGMHRMADGKMMKDSDHRGMKHGGKVSHSDMGKDAPMMKKVAARAVKGHEKRMHSSKKMATGGSVRGDGCAVRGKTKGRMV